MAIKYRPRVGKILECHFGTIVNTNDINGRIPPEMLKKRMVIVINARLYADACLVIPISSTLNQDGINRGHHIELDKSIFKVTDFYDYRQRWALVHHMQIVNNVRLFNLYDSKQKFQQYLNRKEVEIIQKAVIKIIGASSLIHQEKTLPDLDFKDSIN